jgi:hypothetical protein
MAWTWDPHRLSQRDRIALARLAGASARYGWGPDRDVPRETALAKLRDITTDPVVLGMAAGACLVDPDGYKWPAVELLREAGADMTVAAEHAEDVRRALRVEG